MKVFITGASGFVGQEIMTQLLAAGHCVTALVRDEKSIHAPAVTKVIGDVTSPDTFPDLGNFDALIHLVGIIKENRSKGILFDRLHREATANLIAVAKRHGIKRFLHMSANGVYNDLQTAYFTSKQAAEELIRNSELDWTIFRPSLIFGPGDKFTSLLARLIALLPVIPVFGSGAYQLQPVHVTNVAAAFVAALQQHESISQCYCCGGPEVLSYNELLDRIAALQGHKGRKCKLHLPLLLSEPIVALAQHLPFSPLTSDQLKMLTAGNCCADMRWAETFSLTLSPLDSLCWIEKKEANRHSPPR
jgi:NADH dehydrogenase